MEKKNNNYTSFREYLDAFIAGKETKCVEFKHGKGGFPHKTFWESYSSFANTDEGVIIIGVKEKNGEFYTEGLTQEVIDEYEKNFWDAVNNPQKVSHNLLTDGDILKGECDGNHVIVFNIRGLREKSDLFLSVKIQCEEPTGAMQVAITYARNGKWLLCFPNNARNWPWTLKYWMGSLLMILTRNL